MLLSCALLRNLIGSLFFLSLQVWDSMTAFQDLNFVPLKITPSYSACPCSDGYWNHPWKSMLAHTTHAHTHTHTHPWTVCCQSERNHIHSFNKYLSIQYGSGAGDKEVKRFSSLLPWNFCPEEKLCSNTSLKAIEVDEFLYKCKV